MWGVSRRCPWWTCGTVPADFVGTSNVLDGPDAEALVGRAGTFVVRPERIAVFAPGTDPVPGVRTSDECDLESGTGRKMGNAPLP